MQVPAMDSRLRATASMSTSALAPSMAPCLMCAPSRHTWVASLRTPSRWQPLCTVSAHPCSFWYSAFWTGLLQGQGCNCTNARRAAAFANVTQALSADGNGFLVPGDVAAACSVPHGFISELPISCAWSDTVYGALLQLPLPQSNALGEWWVCALQAPSQAPTWPSQSLA